MVNLFIKSAFLLASGFAAGANISSVQVPNTNGTAENSANHYKRYGGGGPIMNIQMFNTCFYKGAIGSIKIQPNICYNLPSINSCILDGGNPGEGKIMFFTQNNCMGPGKSNLRSQWLYPGCMDGDLGGHA
ncbi:hypothetical protein AX774_g2680 [Zancudomyces culisetae]|uniref:Cyanovirin-N domain-containing protein n=1 Tax=Zancudomyces culisetae TaxID=1213189 RepID=A0A1R1PS63_ZANCU|nr:hypothetical protein AX774_g2680 [Zancudomyces culisetae]|eukprot:OMH83798.1 hypothetical protein AX774_g2680 [Zancudomyces culisetae]